MRALILAAGPAIAGSLTLTTAAIGQEFVTFAWHISDVPGLGPSNGNGVIEPGENALVSLHLSFRPEVGGSAIWNSNGGNGQIGTVAGLELVVCQMPAIANLNTGVWVGVAYAPGFNLNVSPAIGPGNGLDFIEFGQFPLTGGPAPSPRNDDWFFRATWRPTDYTPRVVSFGFEMYAPPPASPLILLDVGETSPGGAIIYRPDTWGYNNPRGMFTVVPSPAAWLLLTIACGSRARRTRRKEAGK